MPVRRKNHKKNPKASPIRKNRRKTRTDTETNGSLRRIRTGTKKKRRKKEGSEIGVGPEPMSASSQGVGHGVMIE